MPRSDLTGVALVLALCASPPVSLAADLNFESILDRVSACDIDPDLYRHLWPRQEAALINLPSSGTIKGILLTQFYWSPGRNGRAGDYGVVFNAPIAHVANTFPQYVSSALVNGFERQLLPLAMETFNPRNRSQTLLVCRSGNPA